MNIKFLINKAQELRLNNLNLCYQMGGHISTCLSTIEILVSIYYSKFLNCTPNNVNNLKRDRFILSKGHGCEIVYLILMDLGFYSKNFFYKHYRKNSYKFAGHIDSKVPGVELSTGSLGHGLSFGAGIALSNKYNNYKNKVIVLLGDAECTAGSIWEAANFASHHNLDNLIAYIDFNKIGASEKTSNFVDLKKNSQKWKSFGWDVINVTDGNNIKELLDAQNKITNNNKPTVIIANTIKGKGIKLIENDPIWHTKQIDDSNYELALRDLLKNE